MVTVVDAMNFLHEVQSWESLQERGLGVSEEDDRDLAPLLIEQVEFANVIVVSKCDLASADQVEQLLSLLQLLNPTARIVCAERGQVPLTELLHTERFSEEWAAEHGTWLAVPRGTEQSEAEEYGFRSMVFAARRPLHGARFAALVESAVWEGVIRSKGVLWLATRHDEAVEWSQAGQVSSLQPAGKWAASTPRSEWPEDDQFEDDVAEVWQEPWGDRRCELVLIGQGLQSSQWEELLRECLLTDEELAAGPAVWDAWDDPFPQWEANDESDEG